MSDRTSYEPTPDEIEKIEDKAFERARTILEPAMHRARKDEDAPSIDLVRAVVQAFADTKSFVEAELKHLAKKNKKDFASYWFDTSHIVSSAFMANTIDPDRQFEWPALSVAGSLLMSFSRAATYMSQITQAQDRLNDSAGGLDGASMASTALAHFDALDPQQSTARRNSWPQPRERD